MLTREELKPGMRVEEKKACFPFQKVRSGVIYPDPKDPEQIQVSATGDMSLIPVLIKDDWGGEYAWWPLSSFKVVAQEA